MYGGEGWQKGAVVKQIEKSFIALTCVDGKSSRKVESSGNNFAVQSVAQHDKH